MADNNPAKRFKTNEIIDLTADDIVEPIAVGDVDVDVKEIFNKTNQSNDLNVKFFLSTITVLLIKLHVPKVWYKLVLDLMKHLPKDQLTVEVCSDIGKKALQMALQMIDVSFKQQPEPEPETQAQPQAQPQPKPQPNPKYSVQTLKQIPDNPVAQRDLWNMPKYPSKK